MTGNAIAAKIVDAAFRIHATFLESAYQSALAY
jgi:hypothetical protein